MHPKGLVLIFIFAGLSFSVSAKAEQSVSCRVLASDYARAIRAQEIFLKNIDSQKKNCDSPQSARLSDVLLGRQRLDSCLREIETERKQHKEQTDALEKKIKTKITNSALGDPGIEDCRRALDPVNLEQSPNIAPGSNK
ncbi:MAG: hypothetical protein ACXWQQ_15640 [Pseudobdellovibrio sp.]